MSDQNTGHERASLYVQDFAMALTLVGQHKPLAASAEQLKVLAEIGTCRAFEEQLRHSGLSPLQATGITVFQVNVGKLCNQTCR